MYDIHDLLCYYSCTEFVFTPNIFLSVLDFITDYLRDVYKETRSSNRTEWPPDQPKSVVSNTLIHYKDQVIEREVLDMSKCQEGASFVDKMASSHPFRVTKDISNIFVPADQSFILIEGAPGIGKTVLAKELAFCWAYNKIFQDKRALYLLFARDPLLQDVSNVHKLISYLNTIHDCLSHSEVNVAVDELRKSRGQNIVFVIDGFDECPNDCQFKSFIEKLTRREILPKSMVVITSRPHASSSLHPLADQRIEILGFAKKERDEYITESLKGVPYKKLDLEKNLNLLPIIKSVMHIPLHLAVLLYLFKKGTMPETLTEMNEQFIIHTIYRNNTKKCKQTKVCFKKIEGLPEEIRIVVDKLSQLAFKGLWDRQRLVFTYDEVTELCPEIDTIPGAFNGYGLLQAVEHNTAKGAGTTVSFSFLHLTMQEFLAAYYVSTLHRDEKLNIAFKRYLSDYVWIMYVGIVGLNCDSFIQFQQSVSQESRCHDISQMKKLLIFQCYLEAKHTKIPDHISSIFGDGNIEMHINMEPHNVASLVNFILKSTTQFKSLNLSKCWICDEGMSILHDFLTEHKDKINSIESVCLNQNCMTSLWGIHCDNHIHNDNSTSGLLLIPFLDLSVTILKDKGVIELFAALHHNTALVKLDLSYNKISKHAANAISECLKSNATLQEMNLSHNKLLNGGVIAISDSLKTNNTLRVLNIAKNYITSKGATEIAAAMQSNKTLSHLNLSRNFIEKKGIMSILIARTNGRMFQNLDCTFNTLSQSDFAAINDYNLRENVVQIFDASWNWIICDENYPKLIKTVMCYKDGHDIQSCIRDTHCWWPPYCYKSINRKLLRRVIFCCIKDGFVTKLHLKFQFHFKRIRLLPVTAEAIHENKALTKLFVENFSIDSDEAVAISDCLNANTLEEFSISESDFTNQALRVVAEAIKYNTALRRIDISYSVISTDDMESFGTCLKHNQTLQEFIMVRINMTDQGATTIAEAIKGNTTLLVLDISHNKISDVGVVAIGDSLKHNKHLQQLDVSYNNYVTIEGVKYLAQCVNLNPTLLKVNLMQHCAGNVTLVICDCLKTNSKLQQINVLWPIATLCDDNWKTVLAINELNQLRQIISIENTNIFIDEAKAISNCLQNNNALKKFELSKCNMISKIEEKAMSNLFQASQEFFAASQEFFATFDYYCDRNLYESELHELEQGVNVVINRFIVQRISERINKIMQAMNNITTLQTLTITSCQIRDEGAAIISDYIIHNTSIRELDLSSNYITCKGAEKIFKAIEVNEVLQQLNVSQNEISDDGASAISNCLNSNTTLQHLDIMRNKLNDDGIITISKCLTKNTTLKKLCMTIRTINDGTINTLAATLKINIGLCILAIENDMLAIGNVNCKFLFDQTILSALCNNKTLKKLILSCNMPASEKCCVLQNQVENINTIRRSQGIHMLNVVFLLSVFYDFE